MTKHGLNHLLDFSQLATNLLLLSWLPLFFGFFAHGWLLCSGRCDDMGELFRVFTIMSSDVFSCVVP